MISAFVMVNGQPALVLGMCEEDWRQILVEGKPIGLDFDQNAGGGRMIHRVIIMGGDTQLHLIREILGTYGETDA